jgi:chromosome partitioning protein
MPLMRVIVVYESSAVVGLNSVFDVIEDVNVYSGMTIKVEGIVFTMVKNNSVHIAFKELVRETYQNFKVFNTEIKESVDVSKAQAIRREIFLYKNNSTVVGKAYEDLANELLS